MCWRVCRERLHARIRPALPCRGWDATQPLNRPDRLERAVDAALDTLGLNGCRGVTPPSGPELCDLMLEPLERALHAMPIGVVSFLHDSLMLARRRFPAHRRSANFIRTNSIGAKKGGREQRCLHLGSVTRSNDESSSEMLFNRPHLRHALMCLHEACHSGEASVQGAFMRIAALTAAAPRSALRPGGRRVPPDTHSMERCPPFLRLSRGGEHADELEFAVR
jgi:hypothetical protein